MSTTVNTDGGIGSYVRVKAKRLKTLTVALGLELLDWGQDISLSGRLSFSDFLMVSKAVIGRAPGGRWCGSHVMDMLWSLREENEERSFSC